MGKYNPIRWDFQ